MTSSPSPRGPSAPEKRLMACVLGGALVVLVSVIAWGVIRGNRADNATDTTTPSIDEPSESKGNI